MTQNDGKTTWVSFRDPQEQLIGGPERVGGGIRVEELREVRQSKSIQELKSK